MDDETRAYSKGELVPEPGTYRCANCGEVWTADQAGVRFPPCSEKSGEARWTRTPEEASR